MVTNSGGATSRAAKLPETPVPYPSTACDVTIGLMAVDRKFDAQPFYLGQLPVAGANHNVLFIATANGTSNAIVRAHETATVAVPHAYDPTNLANELYNSNQAPGGARSVRCRKPSHGAVVRNDRVFVGTQCAVAEFGLLGGKGTLSRAHPCGHSRRNSGDSRADNGAGYSGNTQYSRWH